MKGEAHHCGLIKGKQEIDDASRRKGTGMGPGQERETSKQARAPEGEESFFQGLVDKDAVGPPFGQVLLSIQDQGASRGQADDQGKEGEEKKQARQQEIGMTMVEALD